MRIKTGIDMLDHLLKGGIESGNSVLFISTPGVEDLQFAQQCLFTHLMSGGCGIYLVNNKKPAIAKEMLKTNDWDVTTFEKEQRCSFIDCYSGLLGFDSQDTNNVHKPTDIEETLTAIKTAITKINTPPLIIIDSLSSLIDIGVSESDVLKFMLRLKLLSKEHQATIVALFTHWPYADGTIQDLEGCFDCVVKLKAIERKVILRSYFSVDKAGWLDDFERKDVSYKIMIPGGVKVFIPKILVTGPFHAGKTSFIHSASTRAVSVQRLGTTVALDHGHVDYKGFSVDLFGTPGQERFDPILKMLGGEALGVIVVVDSTDPDSFARAKDMLKVTKTEGLPSVIVANKANMLHALSAEDIRDNMHLSADIPIITVVAEDLSSVQKDIHCRLKRSDVDAVLSKLFDMVV
jgi:small GTP-binding protein